MTDRDTGTRKPAPAGSAASQQVLLLFDLDNTLVHSCIDFQAIRQEIIALLHGAGATSESAASLRRLAIPELILLADAHQQRSLAARCWETVLRYEEVGMRAATIEDGAKKTLAQLKDRGYRLAVLTNNARPACDAALRRFGLRPYFDVLLSRDDVAQLKPHGDGVARARRHFNGIVRRAFMIGDSYIDGLAAQHGGAEFIAFRADLNELAERGIAARYVIERLDELLTLDL